MDGMNPVYYPNPPQPDAGEKETVRQGRKFFSRLGLMYFLGTLIIYGVQLGVALLLNIVEPEMLEDANFGLLATMLPMYLVGMPAMILLIRTVPAQQLPQYRLSAGKWTLGAIMCYSVMYCSNLVGIFVTFLIGLLKGGAVDNTLAQLTDSVNPLISGIFMVICAPLFEEYIFRKLLIDRAVRYGQTVAVVLSGFVFGLFHGNLSQFAYATTLGMFFAFIYVRTGRLRYTILMHMTVNFMGGVIAPTLLNFLDVDAMEQALMLQDETEMMNAMLQFLPGLLLLTGYLFCLFGIVIAGFVLLIVFRKKFRAVPFGTPLPAGKKFVTVVCNIGMLLFIVFWVIMIIWQLFQ